MIETVILNYLSQHLPYPVRMEHEPGLPEMYYIIEKTGGSKTNHVYHSVIAIQPERCTISGRSFNYYILGMNKRYITTCPTL